MGKGYNEANQARYRFIDSNAFRQRAAQIQHGDLEELTRDFLAKGKEIERLPDGPKPYESKPKVKPSKPGNNYEQQQGSDTAEESRHDFEHKVSEIESDLRDASLGIREDPELTICEQCEKRICDATGVPCHEVEEILRLDYVKQSELTQSETLPSDMPKTKVQGLPTRPQWQLARDAEVTKKDMEKVLSTIFNGTKPSPLERRIVTLKVLRCSNDLIADLLEKTPENVRKTLSLARQKGRNSIDSHCMTWG